LVYTLERVKGHWKEFKSTNSSIVM